MSVDAHGPIEVQVLRLPGAEDLPMPERATANAAGLDLRACLAEPLTIPPGGRALVPTGFAIGLPAGYEAQVRPRSGLALHSGVTLLNAPGTIDADYRGEIAAILVNHGDVPVTVSRGERIAQLIVQRLPDVRLICVDELPGTGRGAGGFGHTGVR